MPTARVRSSGRKHPERGHSAAPRAQQLLIKAITQGLTEVPRTLVDAIWYALRAGNGDVEHAILTRSLSLTGQAIERVPRDVLAEALAASTDKEAVLRILEAPEMGTPSTDATTIEAARAAGVEARDRLLNARGGSWSVDRVAKYLGLSRQAVDKRRKANRLIGLAIGRHGYVYPSWQFARNGTAPGLEGVLAQLRRHDPWSQVIFLLSPNDRLDGSIPIDGLIKGQIEEVKGAASLFGEHGAV
jgi:biotin operon repressor